MRKKRKPPVPAGRLKLQRAVMAITLSIYPKWCTVHELAREIGPSGALTRAALELIQIGCLESHGSSVRPSKPVARIDTLVKLAGGLGVEPSILLAGINWTPGSTTTGQFEFPDPAGSL